MRQKMSKNLQNLNIKSNKNLWQTKLSNFKKSMLKFIVRLNQKTFFILNKKSKLIQTFEINFQTVKTKLL